MRRTVRVKYCPLSTKISPTHSEGYRFILRVAKCTHGDMLPEGQAWPGATQKLKVEQAGDDTDQKELLLLLTLGAQFLSLVSQCSIISHDDIGPHSPVARNGEKWE